MQKTFSTKEELFAAAQYVDWDNITHLYCSKNRLTTLPTLPKGLLVLECKNNPYLDLSETVFPKTLEKLFCCGRQYGGKTIGAVEHTQLSVLYLCRTASEFLPPMPGTLVELMANNCKLQSLPELAHTSLITLRVEKNKLTGLPSLPKQTVKNLYFSENNIQILPDFQKFVVLRELYAQRNGFTVLPGFAKKIEEVYVCGNKFGENPLPDFSNTSLREFYATSCAIKTKLPGFPVLEEFNVEHNPQIKYGHQIPVA